MRTGGRRENAQDAFVVGVISDTHGVISPRVQDILRFAHHILHAGDYEGDDGIEPLRALAPVTAVRGNMDPVDPRRRTPRTATATLGGHLFYILHDLWDLDLDPAAAGISAVIHGHLHEPSIDWRQGVLFFNSGSASRPRGKGGSTVGKIVISGGTLLPEIIPIR